MIRKYWLYVPLIHSERLADHGFASGLIESIRKDYGKRDPWRDTKEEDYRDITLFSRIARGGPPLEGTTEELWFWMFRMFDAHKPILEKFRRYPYRNETLGRESTESEKEYLNVTEDFGMRG
ncbi:hypothetical protein E1B28_003570 [Marasmius oreades]|uniref:Uncharacterized protein n=1 Tax=Marasmius oreades TaxID=181124 RepID=A0A9P7RM33_9AGAR|nr:uncharacterized protein E1B28_003570 [Marasmius oreades]KAG7086049.1 hypothetical protein E1B28_003570 [Marasmius oreades]